jgi:hypothetical protein
MGFGMVAPVASAQLMDSVSARLTASGDMLVRIAKQRADHVVEG